jgi:hypothetical protein
VAEGDGDVDVSIDPVGSEFVVAEVAEVAEGDGDGDDDYDDADEVGSDQPPLPPSRLQYADTLQAGHRSSNNDGKDQPCQKHPLLIIVVHVVVIVERTERTTVLFRRTIWSNGDVPENREKTLSTH